MKNMSYIILLLVSLSLLMTSCKTAQASGGTHVVIAGSTSVQPYAELLAEEYSLKNSGIIDVQGGGSSQGIKAAKDGTAHIGTSSRSLKEDEKAELWSVTIAKDGLALIMHPSNPVENLSSEQIRDIYKGEITNWSQVGGKNAKIHIISREEGSGTRAAFEEMVMTYKDSEGESVTDFISPKAIVQNTNGAIRQLVTDDANAIGYISLGLVDSEGELGLKPIKPLSIDGVAPTLENVRNQSYGLYREFLFVMFGEPSKATSDFINYVLSAEGQQLLVDEGLVSLQDD